MTWRIEITRTAEKQIAKIARLLRNPSFASCGNGWLRPKIRDSGEGALQGERRRLWRYRVGDYRLICEIQDEQFTVVVREVGHRKDAYR